MLSDGVAGRLPTGQDYVVDYSVLVATCDSEGARSGVENALLKLREGAATIRLGRRTVFPLERIPGLPWRAVSRSA